MKPRGIQLPDPLLPLLLPTFFLLVRTLITERLDRRSPRTRVGLGQLLLEVGNLIAVVLHERILRNDRPLLRPRDDPRHPPGKLERRQSFVRMLLLDRDGADDGDPGVPAQRVLQQPREF